MKAPLPIALLLLAGSAVFCQTAPPTHPRKDYREMFIETAMVLPSLYAQKDFDSIRYYVAMREPRSGSDMDVICIKVLLAIQDDTFSPSLLDNRFFDGLLDYYAGTLEAYKKGRRMEYYSQKGFNPTSYDRQLFGTTSAWARDLLDTRQLDTLTSFLCRVLAGDIRYPGSVIKADKIKYATLDSLVAHSAVLRRDGPNVVCMVGGGVWIPNKNLATLGVHPIASLPSMGFRNKLNEWDMAVDFRFLRAANDYNVLRGGVLYTRHYFFGGYIGMDYTRYIIHSFHFDSGIIAGIGYDGFDIASGGSKADHTYDNLRPLEIKSGNVNLGVRCNYFFNAGTFVGVAAKYNFINYCNPGGTPLDGGALSIAVYAGFNIPTR